MIESFDSITDVKTFGQRLRHARELRALTQRRLAQLSKVSQSAIGNYESDLRASSRSLLSLAKALEVNPAWLQSGQPPMEAAEAPAEWLLRDEPQANAGTPKPGDWLFTEADRALYEQLNPHDRQLLRQAVRAFMEALVAGNAAPAEPSRAPTGPGRKTTPRRGSPKPRG